MITPIDPPAACTAAANSDRYPDFFMAGINMALTDPSGGHDYTGEHKQGYGTKMKRIDTASHFLNDDHQRKISLNNQSYDTGRPNGNGNGNGNGSIYKKNASMLIRSISAVMTLT